MDGFTSTNILFCGIHHFIYIYLCFFNKLNWSNIHSRSICDSWFTMMFNMQMIKLKKLLNQYLIEINWWYTVNKRTEEYRCFDDTKKTWWSIEEERLISKRFWFIKRLVQHWKVDRHKDKYWVHLYKNWDQIFIPLYEMLTMELSIQRNPTKFLASILK